MSTSIMSPITPPLELSRTASTYYERSSSGLPLPSLKSWSLDHSCTTFKIAEAAGTTTATTATTTPSHPKSTRLIEDDPNRDEEDHIQGFKRNRKQAMTLSPATPSKRRCYPMMLRVFGNNPNHCDAQMNSANNNNNNLQQDFASFAISMAIDRAQGDPDESDNIDSNDNDAEVLLPPRLSRRPSQWPSFSSSFDPGQSGDHLGGPTKSSCDRETERFPQAFGSDEDEEDEESICVSPPIPPQFRRNSTIRDSSDLAYSIEEFCQSLLP